MPRRLRLSADWSFPPTDREFDTELYMNYGPTSDVLVRRFIAQAVIGFALIVGSTHGADRLSAEEQLAGGSSSKRLRAQTIQSIPYHVLNQETQQKINSILQKPSVYRRLPVTAINADPDYFRFLTRYPEVVVSIWQLMGITNMTTERTGPYTITTNDGAGTISELELVYGDQNLHIFYGRGTYEGPILKRKLSGQCVLVLKTDSRAGTNGNPITTSQLDVFLKIDNATAGLVAKTITPLVGSTADHNFVQSLNFVQRLNETTQKNGPGVQQMGNRLSIAPEVRQRFNDVVNLVFQRAVNSSIPDEPGIAVMPASMETRYSVPQPPRTLNGPPPQPYQSLPRQRAPFENLRDSGSYQQPQRLSKPFIPVMQTGAMGPSPYSSGFTRNPGIENVASYPPRGFRPPGYASQATWNSDVGVMHRAQPIPVDTTTGNGGTAMWRLR